MPQILKARIDEENCIGCHKCVRACPTDAIVGAKQMLHTILPSLCTACAKCIDACPTNCIVLATLGPAMSADQEQQLTLLKQQRLSGISASVSHQALSSQPPQGQEQSYQTVAPNEQVELANDVNVTMRKQAVADAIARAKAKKKMQYS